MRLIDADELMEKIKKWLPKDPCGKEQSVEEVVATDLSVSMLMEIEEMPTAYDVDKVCTQIEEKSCMYGLKSEWCIKREKAIEIVRNGGMK